MRDTTITTVPLGMHWPTADPFLFCAHHRDHFPAGNEALGPRASLAGRTIGSDFSGTDGWSMYHGTSVPGFPQHPHRGFETISFVRSGVMDHADSLGATARFGAGDVQWMTAGAGIVHSEMFPLLEPDDSNPLELFQIWLNLPAEDKLVPPHFKMMWSADIPKLADTDGAGRSTVVTVIAGALGGLTPPSAPPSSWAARPDTDVAIWHLELEPGATWQLPPAMRAAAVRSVYVYDLGSLTVDGAEIPLRTAATVPSDRATTVRASDHGTVCLVLQGRPIAEPVAQYGPFVMNDRAGLEKAFVDYQTTGFGGWPWATDDPDHGPDRRRFARHADGRIEAPPEPDPET